MVLQAEADRQRLPDLDPERRELILGADAREHQQHRRLIRARGEDHLTGRAQLTYSAVARDLDPDGARPLEQDPQRHGPRDDVEVRARPGRSEERVRRAAAQTVALGELEATHALLPGAGE